MARRRGPDFFLIGAPKAGTSALHKALEQHPGLFLSRPKEPKYYMCGDSPPPAYKGPGDAHSNQEWVWQRERYLALFDGAPEGALRGESTPFYLYNRDARRRIAADNPDAKLVAVLRDPVDRAYSNWMHLWMDGLEPRCDVVEAVKREQWRIDQGWAPFWHYSSLGMYGRQLADLYDHVPADQVLLLRYKELVASPGPTLRRVFDFLGVPPVEIETIPADNSRPFVEDGLRTRLLGPVIRAGAWAGQFAPPQAWRRASSPLVRQLQRSGEGGRPSLTPEQRSLLLEPHREDIALLTELTGQDFSEWLLHRDGGSFATRQAEEQQRVGQAG
ncbi:sulfotransferase [Nocardioides sp. CFH 31398]|uniref:sulfotransferase family protein n=1 Tax=Nocardioides sp. CFH 31398 TaxID=2919579 RepID=UPI001F0609D8|nr:sulfotransferase [Nocardioides sp. CFH 31398]MCH1867416.1 sulfotransferase [Nocardioides sp. CFH 31398]MCH1868587.1 sulfotransferase [Nocardioides sp. CFH 31398]